jgi:hypothetical protein
VARTRNLLSDDNALLRFSSSDGANIGISSVSYDWEAENATLSIVGTEFVVNTRYVLIASPDDSNTVVIRLANSPLNIADNGRVLSANMRMKANSPMNVEALLYIDSASASYSPTSTSYTSGLYNAVHTNQASVPDDGNVHTATIELTISGHSAAGIHLTLPHLIHDMALFENPFVNRSRTFLPDFYFEIDSARTQPSYPFFRLVDILTSAAGETAIEHNRMYGVESEQVPLPEQVSEYWARSTLVSPRSVRENYVPWLAQFTGGPLRQNIQKSDGSLFFTNEGTRRDFVEWQLNNGYYGRSAGSREAMTEAAKQVLLYTKDGSQSTFSVAVTPRYLGDPFAIRVQTLANETPDASDGEESELVKQSVSWAKPMGYTVFYETVDEFFLSFDDPTLGVLDSMRFG